MSLRRRGGGEGGGGGGSTFQLLMLIPDLLKSQILLCPVWGGGGCKGSVPTFDAESKKRGGGGLKWG